MIFEKKCDLVPVHSRPTTCKVRSFFEEHKCVFKIFVTPIEQFQKL